MLEGHLMKKIWVSVLQIEDKGCYWSSAASESLVSGRNQSWTLIHEATGLVFWLQMHPQ